MQLVLCAMVAAITLISVVVRASGPVATLAPMARRARVDEVRAARPLSRSVSVSSYKRDLTPDGLGKFLAPNTTSINAACYPMYIEVFTPGPPRNLTAWYQKGTETFSQLVFEWPRIDNPWIDENTALNATWDRLSIGPGSLASIIVQGYLNDVAESAPFTVQPSNDRSCYNADYTGDATWGTTTGLGITTTYAPSTPNTYTDSGLPSAIPAGQENTYRPDAVNTAGVVYATESTTSTSSPTQRRSVALPVVGAVVGTLALVGIGLGVWFCLRKKRKAAQKPVVKGGATAAGDEAPYVLDLSEDGDDAVWVGRTSGAMRERDRGRPQLQAYTYGSGSNSGGSNDSSTPFMSRTATSADNLRIDPATGVVQERDSGMPFSADTVPPDYADATATSSQATGSNYFQSPSSVMGPNFGRTLSASSPSDVDSARRGSGKTMRG